MLFPRVKNYLRLLCAIAWLTFPGVGIASEYHGQVTLGGLPVCGATVTATRGDKKTATVTDTQGLYSFADLADGTWAIRIEMTGFASTTQDVSVAADAVAGRWEMKLLSLDQIRAESKPIKAANRPVFSASAATPAAKAEPAKPQSGNAPAAAPVAAATEEVAQRAADGLLINGSVNNAATSQFALSQAFGNTRNGGRSLYNGGIGLILDNSALNAKQYSLSGVDTPKPGYNRVTGTVTFGGPLKIPRLLLRGPNFFIGYQWSRNRNDTTQSALVPDAAERSGDLSELPVQIVNPVNGVPYAGNKVPVSPQALTLLNFYPLPLPSLAGNPRYNYQVPLISNTHLDAMQIHLQKGVGRKDNINGGFNVQSTRTSGANLFGFVDTTNFLGMNTNVNWYHNLGRRWSITSGYNFSRSRTQVTPYFANRENVSLVAGILGNDQSPANWGPPGLSFSSGIVGLSDGRSSSNRNETNAGSVSVSRNGLRHDITFGGDFRRQEFNTLAQQNPRGTFSFTSSGSSSSGSDLADFLLGSPDTSAISFGNPDKYLRQSIYDAYVDDDWRIRSDLTVKAGVRWEYGAPITELHDRLVNLDVASGFAAVAPVLATSPVGLLTGQHYPASLMRPDRLGIEPRIGISWRPISGSSVVVRAGYGVYDDTSVYQATALAMAQQAPLSKNINIANSATSACRFDMTNAFNPACSPASTDTFGVDPNFKVGYAQTWQLQVQRDLPRSLQMTATYLGVKGTRGVQQFLPNTSPPVSSTPPPCVICAPSGFTYRTSNGNSTREAGTLQLRRRLRSGFTASVQYTFSKSLDDDSMLGGQGPVAAGASGQSSSAAGIAQDWLNLRGERGLSTFDQRHLLNVNAQYTTGMGIGGRTLMSGWRGTAFKEWTLLTNIAVGSGLPETPTYIEPVSGTGFSNIVRPNYTGAPVYAASPGHSVNAAAFAAPASGQWGNVRRNSITGPGQFSLNASVARTFRLRDRYNLDIRIDSTNALNHVTYPSWYTTLNPVRSSAVNPVTDPAVLISNNSLFGVPLTANTMRTVQATMRLRF